MNKKYFSLVLLIAVVAVALALFLGKEKKSEPTMAEVKSLNESVAEQQRVTDQGYLKSDKEVEPQLLYAAMLRRAHKGDPLAFERAEELIESDNKMLKSGAIEAFGFLDDDDSLDLLVKYLSSEEALFQEAAIKGLSHNLNDSRKQILQDYLAGAKDFLAKKKVYEILYKNSNDFEFRAALFDEVFEFYLSEDRKYKVDALDLLAKLDSENKQLIDLARGKLEKMEGYGVEQAFFVKYLSRNDVKFVQERHKALYSKGTIAVKLAILRTFGYLCFRSPLETLKSWVPSAMNQSHLFLLYKTIAGLQSKDAKEFLESELSKESTKAQKRDYLQKILKDFQLNSTPRCKS